MKWIRKLLLSLGLAVSLLSCGQESPKGLELVDALTEGHSLGVDEFAKAFVEQGQDTRTISGATYSFLNFMPQNIYRKYGIGAFEATAVAPGYVWKTYLLMVDGTVFRVTWEAMGQETASRFTQFLFSDYDQDGHAEVTAICFLPYLSGTGFVRSIDTRTKCEQYIWGGHQVFFSFQIHGNQASIYRQNVTEDYKVEEEAVLYSDILPYTRSMAFLRDSFAFEGTLFSSKVYALETPKPLPFIYKGIYAPLRFRVDMTYLGETKEVYVTFCGLDVSLPTFRCGETVIEFNTECVWFGLYQMEYVHGEVYSREFTLADSLARPLTAGVYDLTLVYENESITIERVLEIR